MADQNPLLGRLARSSVAAFAIYVVGTGLTYLAQLGVARVAGAQSYGIYAYVFAWVTVLAYLSALGFDVSLLRFVPTYAARQEWPLLRGVIQYAERRAIIVGLGVVVAGGSVVLIRAADLSPELVDTFLVGLFLAPVLALLWIRSSIVRAFGGVLPALVPDRVLRDGLLFCWIAFAGLTGWWQMRAPLVMLGALATSAIGLAVVSLAARFWRPAVVTGSAPAYAASVWRRTALPLVTITVAEVLMNRTGVMLLGWGGDTTDAGIYSVAFNLTFIVILPRTAVNALFAPIVADLFVRNELTALQVLITRAALGTFVAAMSIALPLALLAEPLLTWFGRDFGGGSTALYILLIGQLVAAGAGPQLFVMAMTGHERSAAVLLVLSAIGNAILGSILIGLWGLFGAAVATTITLIACSAAMGAFIWKRLHLVPGLLAPLQCRRAVVGGAAARSRVITAAGKRALGRKSCLRWMICVPLLLLLHGRTLAYDNLVSARVLPTPEMPEPGYLQPATDPVFGTPFTRATDPGRQILPGAACGPRYCTHRYSSAQPWNADQSLLEIVNGCHPYCALFLDGHTYKPLFWRTIPNECEWHPTNPALMICVFRNQIYTWAPRTNVKAVAFEADDYSNLQFGPYKGNPSLDGSRLVVRARNRAGASVAFAYDLSAHRKYPDIELSKLSGANDYCSISPSGRYIFCSQDMPDQTNQAYVFTVDGRQLQHWTANHRPGHGDMTIDDDGNDVYVGISKADPDKYHIIKRRLVDGAVTDLARYGEGQHASIRNIRRPGWVFVTYTGSYAEVAAHPAWTPFYQEVVALRIDGSGEVRRIVQNRAAKSDYWSESHASPSPDGSQVIWSSNWGKPGGPVSDFVAQVAWPEAISAKSRDLKDEH